MPFREVSAMAGKEEFVRLASGEGANVRALCRRFGVSASVGYKWLNRFRTDGRPGLEARSRRPLGSPSRTPDDIEAAVLALRARHPAWGGRKIAARLKALGLETPAPSTITAILRRHGMEIGAHGGGAKPFVRFEHACPNDLWQMDFKGHVAMAEGRLHPLTVLDDHSRFCVVLEACADQRTATVKTALVQAFRRYGLPLCVITDNGAPWGDGPGSPFTPLGVFLIEQNIAIAHSTPYHPQTLGKDERFHRSLKAEALSGPPFADLAAAAVALARWRDVYNLERPHEALGLATPVTRHGVSPRAFGETVAPFAYGPDDRVRRVQLGGRVSFQGRTLRVPKAFRGKDIALRPAGKDGSFHAFFRHQKIAELDLNHLQGQTQCVRDVPEQVFAMSPV